MPRGKMVTAEQIIGNLREAEVELARGERCPRWSESLTRRSRPTIYMQCVASSSGNPFQPQQMARGFSRWTWITISGCARITDARTARPGGAADPGSPRAACGP